MLEREYDFSIVFEQLDKLADEPDTRLTADEPDEYEEMRVLREIVLDIQAPERSYVTST